mmetsp:Transcript_22264/g.40111  ORF Transcript_22264/g.40111 Transcript_22264/m.40111 type:complete len:262 (+) Transcript_22264:69-854(+)
MSVLYNIGVAILVVLVVIAVVFFYRSFRDAEWLTASEAARKIYEANHGVPENLPDKFRGIFWMSTNAAPELLCTLEGGEFDPEKKMLKVDASGDLTWTYDTSRVGQVYWFFCLMASLCRSKFYFYFTDDTFTNVSHMHLYAFDLIYVPLMQTWAMEQADVPGEEGQGNTWLRHIIFPFAKAPNETASYKLVKVLDKNGKQLPAFDEMMVTLRKYDDQGVQLEPGIPVKGINTKHNIQILNGRAKPVLPGGSQFEKLVNTYS